MRYQELLRLSFFAMAVCLVAGCTVGPKYRTPRHGAARLSWTG